MGHILQSIAKGEGFEAIVSSGKRQGTILSKERKQGEKGYNSIFDSGLLFLGFLLEGNHHQRGPEKFQNIRKTAGNVEESQDQPGITQHDYQSRMEREEQEGQVVFVFPAGVELKTVQLVRRSLETSGKREGKKLSTGRAPKRGIILKKEGVGSSEEELDGWIYLWEKSPEERKDSAEGRFETKTHSCLGEREGKKNDLNNDRKRGPSSIGNVFS